MKALPLDKALLAACARFDVLEGQTEAHHCTGVTDPVFDGLMKEQNELISRLEDFIPQTAEGRQARARVAYGLVADSWAGDGVEGLALEVLREIAGVPL